MFSYSFPVYSALSSPEVLPIILSLQWIVTPHCEAIKVSPSARSLEKFQDLVLFLLLDGFALIKKMSLKEAGPSQICLARPGAARMLPGVRTPLARWAAKAGRPRPQVPSRKRPLANGRLLEEWAQKASIGLLWRSHQQKATSTKDTGQEHASLGEAGKGGEEVVEGPIPPPQAGGSYSWTGTSWMTPTLTNLLEGAERPGPRTSRRRRVPSLRGVPSEPAAGAARGGGPRGPHGRRSVGEATARRPCRDRRGPRESTAGPRGFQAWPRGTVLCSQDFLVYQVGLRTQCWHSGRTRSWRTPSETAPGPGGAAGRTGRTHVPQEDRLRWRGGLDGLGAPVFPCSCVLAWVPGCPQGPSWTCSRTARRTWTWRWKRHQRRNWRWRAGVRCSAGRTWRWGDRGWVWGESVPGDAGGSETEGACQNWGPEGSERRRPTYFRPELHGKVSLWFLQMIWETDGGDDPRLSLQEWRGDLQSKTWKRRPEIWSTEGSCRKETQIGKGGDAQVRSQA